MGVETEHKQIEIGFGTVFVARSRWRDVRYVIVDVGANEALFASQITKVNNREALGLPGILHPKSIKKVVELWSKEHMIQGFENGMNGNIPEDVLELINTYSKQKSRIVSIS